MKIFQSLAFVISCFFTTPLIAQEVREWSFGTALENVVLHATESSDGSIVAVGIEESMFEDVRSAAVWRLDPSGKTLNKATFGNGKWNFAKKIIETKDRNLVVIGNNSPAKTSANWHRYSDSITGWVKIFSEKMKTEASHDFSLGQQVFDVVWLESRQEIQVLGIEKGNIFLKILDKNGHETASINLSQKSKISNAVSAGLLLHENSTYIFGAKKKNDDSPATPFLISINDTGETQSVDFFENEIESVAGMVGIGKKLFLVGTAKQIRTRENAFLLTIATNLEKKGADFSFQEYEEREFDEAKGIIVLNDDLLAIFGNSRSQKLGSKNDDGFVIWVNKKGNTQTPKPSFWGEKLAESFETAFIRGDSALWLMGFRDKGNFFGGNNDGFALRFQNNFTKKIDPARIPKTKYVPPPVEIVDVADVPFPSPPPPKIDPPKIDPDIKPTSVRPTISYIGFEKDEADTVRYRNEFELKTTIISPDKLILADFRLKFNGREYHLGQSAKDLKATLNKKDDERYDLRCTLKLQPQFNTCQVWTEATGSKKSTTEARVRYAPHDRGILYVVSIGVPDESGRLKYTQKDAEDFADLFKNQKGKLYERVEINLLNTQEQTLNQNMAGAITYFTLLNKRNALTEKDGIVLFISTHGLIDDNGDFRLKSSKYDSENKKYTTLSFKEDILDVLQPLPCNKFVFIDACHSGSVNKELSGRKDVADDFSGAFAKLIESTKDVRVLASCGSGEFSYEDDDWENGAFTKVFKDMLSQKSICEQLDKNGDLAISLSELYFPLQKNVQDAVKKTRKNASQTPFIPKKQLEEDVPFFAF